MPRITTLMLPPPGQQKSIIGQRDGSTTHRLCVAHPEMQLHKNSEKQSDYLNELHLNRYLLQFGPIFLDSADLFQDDRSKMFI